MSTKVWKVCKVVGPEGYTMIGPGLTLAAERGQWFAAPADDATASADLTKAIGPCDTRPDLETLLIKRGIGFMDLIG